MRADVSECELFCWILSERQESTEAVYANSSFEHSWSHNYHVLAIIHSLSFFLQNIIFIQSFISTHSNTSNDEFFKESEQVLNMLEERLDEDDVVDSGVDISNSVGCTVLQRGVDNMYV